MIADVMTNLLDKKGLLYWSNSDRLETFIDKTVKEKLDANSMTIKTIENEKDFTAIKELLTVQPIFSDYWLIDIDLGKFKKNLAKVVKIISFLVKNSTTMFFLIKSNHYLEYKPMQTEMRANKIEDYLHYIYCGNIYGYLFDKEFNFLQSAVVKDENKRLNPKLTKYVAKGYGNDINAMFKLFDYLNEGIKITSRSKIVELIGIGGNTVPNFVHKLLKDPPTTAKGTEIVISNRVKEAHQLLDEYKPNELIATMNKLLTDYIDIKGLIISGTFTRNISETQDKELKQRYSRYQRVFNMIKEVPLSRLLRLKLHIANEKEGSNILRFIYNYYYDFIKCEVVPVISTAKQEEKKEPSEDEVKEQERKLQRAEDTNRERELSKYISVYGVTEGRKKYASDKERGTSILASDVANGKVRVSNKTQKADKDKHIEDLTLLQYIKKYGRQLGKEKFDEDKKNGILVYVKQEEQEEENAGEREFQKRVDINKIKEYKKRQGLL